MGSESLVVIMIINFIIIGIVIFFAIRVSKKRREQALGNLKSKSTTKGFRGQEKGSGVSNGTPYRYEYFPGAKNSPPYFKVMVDAPSGGSFKIAKETSFDKFCERIGLSAEIKTGDSYFDDNFYITTDKTDFCEAFFAPLEKRDAIRRLYDVNFKKVEHDGESIEAICIPFNKKMSVDDDLVAQVVEDLTILSKDMPQGNFLEYDESLWKVQKILVSAVPIVVGVIGIVSIIIGQIMYSPLDDGKVFLDSLKYSLVLYILFVWSAFLLLKGRSSSHRIFITVVLIGLFAFPFGGFGIETFYNGRFDTSKSSTHHALLEHKYYVKTKNGRNYYARVSSWRPGRSTEKLKIGRGTYERINENETSFIITTKPGKLGFEWLVNFNVKY